MGNFELRSFTIINIHFIGDSWRYLIDGNGAASRLFWEFFHFEGCMRTEIEAIRGDIEMNIGNGRWGSGS